MDNEIIAPKTDIMFKSLFTRYVNCLKSLISALLNIPVEDIKDLQFLNTELYPKNVENKSSRLDFAVSIDDKVINIEIQLNKTSDFVERSLYYWSSLYCMGSKKGESYSAIPKTIAINILDYNLFDDDMHRHSAVLSVQENGKLLTDKFSMLFFELKKVSDQIDSKNSVKLWLQFLKSTSKKELEMVKNAGDNAVAEAVDGVYRLSKEDILRYQSVFEHMREMDEAAKDARMRLTAIEEGREEGIKEGIKEGRETRDKEIKEKLQKLNFPQDQIDQILS